MKSWPVDQGDLCPGLSGVLDNGFANGFVAWNPASGAWMGEYFDAGASFYIDGVSGILTVTCSETGETSVFTPTTIGSLDPAFPYIVYHNETDLKGFCCDGSFPAEDFVLGSPKPSGGCALTCYPNNFPNPFCVGLWVPASDVPSPPEEEGSNLRLKTIPMSWDEDTWTFEGDGEIHGDSYHVTISCRLSDNQNPFTTQGGGWQVQVLKSGAENPGFYPLADALGTTYVPYESGGAVVSDGSPTWPFYAVDINLSNCTAASPPRACSNDAYLPDTVYLSFSNPGSGLESLDGFSIPLTRDRAGTWGFPDNFLLDFPIYSTGRLFGGAGQSGVYEPGPGCYINARMYPNFNQNAPCGSDTIQTQWNVWISLAQNASGACETEPYFGCGEMTVPGSGHYCPNVLSGWVDMSDVVPTLFIQGQVVSSINNTNPYLPPGLAVCSDIYPGITVTITE